MSFFGKKKNKKSRSTTNLTDGYLKDYSTSVLGLNDKYDLEIVLPNGQLAITTVDNNLPMMDLLIHLTSALKLDRNEYMLCIENAISGQPVDLKPHQTISSIGGVGRVFLVHRYPKERKGLGQTNNSLKRETSKKERTSRILVSLPGNEKFVTQINPDLPLTDIYRYICDLKGLDVADYTLAIPNELDVNWLCSLSDYNVNEVSLVHKDPTMLRWRTPKDQRFRYSTPDLVAAQYQHNHSHPPLLFTDHQPIEFRHSTTDLIMAQKQMDTYDFSSKPKKKKRNFFMSLFRRKKKESHIPPPAPSSGMAYYSPDTSSERELEENSIVRLPPAVIHVKPRAQVRPQPQQGRPMSMYSGMTPIQEDEPVTLQLQRNSNRGGYHPHKVQVPVDDSVLSRSVSMEAGINHAQANGVPQGGQRAKPFYGKTKMAPARPGVARNYQSTQDIATASKDTFMNSVIQPNNFRSPGAQPAGKKPILKNNSISTTITTGSPYTTVVKTNPSLNRNFVSLHSIPSSPNSSFGSKPLNNLKKRPAPPPFSL